MRNLIAKKVETVRDKNLTSLKFSSCEKVTHQDIKILVRLIKNSKKLTSVWFDFESIDVVDKKLLMRVLRANKNLMSIKCSFNLDGALETLGASLKYSAKLVSLNLLSSSLSHGRDLRFLTMKTLRQVSFPEKVNLMNNDAIAFIVNNNKSLESLRCGSYNLNDAQCVKLGRTICSSHLQHFHFTIGAQWATANNLAGVMSSLKGSKLTELTLSGPLPASSLKYLTVLIKNNAKLTRIHLVNTDLINNRQLKEFSRADEDIDNFIEVLEQSQIRSIKFSNAGLNDQDANLIAKLIANKNNPIYQNIRTRNIKIQQVFEALLEDHLLILKNYISENDPLYLTLKMQKDLLKKIRPLSFQEEVQKNLVEFLVNCDAYIKEADKRLGHGWFDRTAEIFLKIMAGFVLGLSFLLGAIYFLSVFNVNTQDTYNPAFFKRAQTPGSKSVLQFKQKLHDAFERQLKGEVEDLKNERTNELLLIG